MKTAFDVMTTELITMHQHQPTYFAFLYMNEHKIRHIPILDDAEVLKGVISDRDIKRRISEAFDPDDMGFDDIAFMMQETRQIMSCEPVFAYADTPLKRVVDLMLTHQVSSIPVVSEDEHKLVGMVTSTDLLTVLSALLHDETDATGE